jgi:hypothetical protein
MKLWIAEYVVDEEEIGYSIVAAEDVIQAQDIAMSVPFNGKYKLTELVPEEIREAGFLMFEPKRCEYCLKDSIVEE